jgi:PAS domain S-box-containing protein
MSNIRNKELLVKTGDCPILEQANHYVVTDIAENPKKGVEVISNSEEKLKLVMNAALDAIIWIDTKGDVSFWNPQAEVIFGWTETEAFGQPLAQLIVPEQFRNHHNEGMALYLKTGKGPALNRLMELSAVKRTGEEFPIELTIMPIKQGDEEFFCAFIRDITERKKADIALQAAYNEKNIILESIADGFFTVDKNWIVTYWNNVAEKMLATPKNNMLGHHLWETFSGSVGSKSYNKYHEALETGQVIEFEDYYQTLDKWFEINAYPSATGLSVHFKDITERKIAESALQKAYEEKNTVLESIDDGFFALDTNSVVTYWNKRAEILLDTKKEDLIGKNLHEVFTVRGSRIFYDNYVKALKEKITIQFEGFSTLSKKWFAVSAYGSDNGLSVYFKDVTEQKNAAEKIKESELRYRSLIEQATDTICIIDASGRFIEMNPSGCSMFGYSKEEVLQLFLTDVLFEEDLKIDPIRFDELKAGKTTGNERRIKRKNGTAVEVELNAKMIEDERIMVFGRDISARKESERLIKESEAKYRSFFEGSMDGILLTVTDGEILSANPAACEIFKMTEEEICAAGRFGLVDLTDPRVHSLIEERKRNGKAKGELTLIRKDGSKFEAELTSALFIDSYGRERTSMIVRDITESKQAEIRIRESELRYRSIIEQATDAICIADPFMKIIDINPYCCEMLGYTKEEFLTLTITDIFLPEDLIQNPFKIAELKTGKVIRNERRLKTKDGTVIEVEISARILEDGRFIVFAHDIAERKQAEDKLKESELRYRSLNEQATDAICITDASMKFINVNPYGCEILGYTEEEALQLSLPDILFPEDLADNPIKLSELKLGHTIRNERRLKRKNGTPVDMDVSTKLMEDGRMIMFGHDISESKNAAKLIIESEAKYRTLFEQNMAGVYQTTASGVIVNCNDAFAKMLKYDSPAELQKINASELYFSVAERNDFTRDVIEQKNINNYESVLKCKDGSPLHFIENISLRKDDITGEEVFNGIMIDITEKKQAEIQLKESNERYNLISQATNDMVWDWDLVTGKVYRNKEGWKKIFKTGDIDIENENIDDWDSRVHPDDQQKVQEVEAEIQKSEKDFFEVECRVLRYDGTYAYVHDRGHILRNEQGQAVRLIGATQDITARKEAELQVAKSELRFRSLVQNSSDIICIFNDRGYFKYSSPAIKKILGFEPEETIEKNAFAFLHPDDINPLKDYLSQPKPDMYREMPLLRFKNTHGEWKWIESRVTNMCDNPEVAGYVFNCRDITDRIILENQLENERQLKQLEITQAVITAQENERQELGSELHDNINQILAGSRLYLGLAQKELKAQHQVDYPYLKETDNLITSAITEIRNLSHSLVAPSLQESELLSAIDKIIEVTKETSGININLQAYGFDETDIPDKLKLGIYRIIQEQFNNILKHAAAQKVIVKLVQDKEKILLSIKDDGIGFDTQKKPNGVGLMNIKTRASLFNGEVIIISSQGNGCELRVTFN